MAQPTFTTMPEMQARATTNRDRLVTSTFKQSELLGNMRIKTLAGKPGESWRVVTKRPAAQTRRLHGTYTRQTGKSRPGFEGFRIYGTRVGHDRKSVDWGLANPAQDLRQGAESVRKLVDAHLINGDPDIDDTQMAGAYWWAANSTITDTVIDAGSTAGGAALSVRLLRDAIDECDGPTKLIMGRKMRNLLTAASEDSSVRGTIIGETKNDFGMRLKTFDDLPIVTVSRDGTEAQAEIMDFDEAAASGANTATSILIVNDTPDVGWYLVQDGPPKTYSESDGSPQNDEDVEWGVCAVAKSPRSVIRVRFIGELAVVS